MKNVLNPHFPDEETTEMKFKLLKINQLLSDNVTGFELRSDLPWSLHLVITEVNFQPSNTSTLHFPVIQQNVGRTYSTQAFSEAHEHEFLPLRSSQGREGNRWFRCVGAEGEGSKVKGIGSFCGRGLEVVREGLPGDAMAVGVEKICSVGGDAGFPNWRLDYRSLQGQGNRNVLQSDWGVTSFSTCLWALPLRLKYGN